MTELGAPLSYTLYDHFVEVRPESGFPLCSLSLII